MANDFPADLERFLSQHIESLPQLEALLLVRREPERTWTLEEFARQLYVGPAVCATLVADLKKHGFIEQPGSANDTFRYHAADADTAALVARLDKLYQERRVAVIAHVYSRPTQKVQTFADAFRFRREP